MKLVLIVGDSAVGKMTVGQELMKITDLRLFHNHMTIEPVLDIFNDFNVDVILKLRYLIFEEFVKTDNEGMIYTCMWAYDCQEDWDIMNKILGIFEGAEIYCVELTAPLEVRLQRNATENRLKNKASKRNLETSRNNILKHDEKYRLESYDGEITFENYIKIDNTNLSPEEVAQRIKERFGL
jgi:hypothetical protein